MSIIKYSIENELFGSRNLNQNKHTGLSATLPNLKTIANTDTFTRRLPNILREHEFNLTRSQINKIFTAQWLDDRKVLMGTKCNKVFSLKLLFLCLIEVSNRIHLARLLLWILKQVSIPFKIHSKVTEKASTYKTTAAYIQYR